MRLKLQNVAPLQKNIYAYFYEKQILIGHRLINAKDREIVVSYFLRYITSFTSFTVRGTSGNAAATKLGA
jgi:hypothetical protein